MLRFQGMINGFLGLGVLLWLAGCGHVAGNYPVLEGPEPDIPEEFKPQGKSTPIVWEEPDQVRGFLVGSTPAKKVAERFEKFAQDSRQQMFAAKAEFYRTRADEGMTTATIAVFFRFGVERRVRTGDFLITFTDGTQTRDVGISHAYSKNPANPVKYSGDGPLRLPSKMVDRGKPMFVTLYLEGTNLSKQILSVRLKASKNYAGR